MGEEDLCIAYHEQPELIHEMLRTIGDTAFRVLERVSAAVQVDQLSVHEDMAGKSGPLAGPAAGASSSSRPTTGALGVAPGRGARLFSQDSDGNMNAVIAGLPGRRRQRACTPWSRRPAWTSCRCARQYGDAARLVGGIDKHVLRRSEAAIARSWSTRSRPCCARAAGLRPRPPHPQRHAAGKLPLLRAHGARDARARSHPRRGGRAWRFKGRKQETEDEKTGAGDRILLREV